MLVRQQQGCFNFDTKAARDTKWQLTEIALGTYPSTADCAHLSIVSTNGTNGHCAHLSTVNAQTVLTASTNIRVDLRLDKKEEASNFDFREGKSEADFRKSQPARPTSPRKTQTPSLPLMVLFRAATAC